MNPLLTVLISLAGLGIGGAAGYFFYNKDSSGSKDIADAIAVLKKEAQTKSKEVLNDAKERAEKIREMLKSDEESWDSRLDTLNQTVDLKDQTAKRKQARNDEIKKLLDETKKIISETKENINKTKQEADSKLEEKAQCAKADLAKSLIEDAQNEIIRDKDMFFLKHDNNVKDELDKIAKKVVLYVIHRFSGATSVERKNTNVTIPRDVMKGMLIGRGGANITYLESLFPGIQFVFEHEAKTLTVTGFNLLQRNIASLTVKKLIRKRQISPAEIKRAYDKAKREIDEDIMRTGRKALKTVGIKGCGNDLIWLVGRLKFRTSYRQNILKHSIEMAFFAEMIASEIGCDTHIAKVATFFHDIGKAIDHDIDTDEGHDYLTKDILEKNNFHPDIVHAAFVHHDAEPQRIPEAFIVKAADAISGGRPGARQETIDAYLERINKLEEIARSFPEVKKTYAVSAGREVRLFVDPHKIQDGGLTNLAENAAHEIEENLVYPGKIKVHVIRTLKATETAK